MHAMRDYAWDQDLALGQFDVLPHLPFVLVTRVRRLDEIGRRPDLQHEVYEMLQLEVVNARRDVHAVAGVKADSIFRYAAQGVIDGLDAQRDELPAVLDRRV